MKKIVLAISILALTSVGASAADLPAQPGAAWMVPVINWSGFYIGGNVGGGWGRAGFTDEFPAVGSFSGNPTKNGVVGGGQIGYNWQFLPNWVIGLEGGFTFANLNGSTSAIDTFGFSRRLDSSFENLWDVAARLGYASNNWLFYGKGGYAGTRLDLDTVSLAPSTAGLLMSAWSKTLAGFVAGAGIEYAIAPNWIVGVEYDYYGFQKQDALGVSTFNGFTAQNYRGIDPSVQTITLRLSYKFGDPVLRGCAQQCAPRDYAAVADWNYPVATEHRPLERVSAAHKEKTAKFEDAMAQDDPAPTSSIDRSSPLWTLERSAEQDPENQRLKRSLKICSGC